MKSFPSKILLFGEHIINKGAHGLAIPYHKLFCGLSFKQQDSFFYQESNFVLKELANFIAKNDKIKSHYKLAEMLKDINNGLGFCMNIPIGYGLGSSGAIVAAIFDAYGINKKYTTDELRVILAETEGFFHGKSSGLDPLVSFLDASILIKEKVQKLTKVISWQENVHIYLIDSQKPRKTEPLVNSFLENYKKDENFKKVIDEDILPLNNQIIKQFVDNSFSNVTKDIKQLSQLQLKHYNMLILPEYKTLWQRGLDSDEFYMKICGAGGGGYFLAFSQKKINIPNSILL